MRIGEQVWQFEMGGEDWKKSLHPATREVPVDPLLADDVRTMQNNFDLSICAADYIILLGGSRQ